MINALFSYATFPNTYHPYPQNGDQSNPSNYKPISILPVLSKIFERAIYLRLIHFLADNSILYPA